MTKKLYITFALLGSLLITSCDSFLDIQVSQVKKYSF